MARRQGFVAKQARMTLAQRACVLDLWGRFALRSDATEGGVEFTTRGQHEHWVTVPYHPLRLDKGRRGRAHWESE